MSTYLGFFACLLALPVGYFLYFNFLGGKNQKMKKGFCVSEVKRIGDLPRGTNISMEVFELVEKNGEKSFGIFKVYTSSGTSTNYSYEYYHKLNADELNELMIVINEVYLN